jgi:hypothetical protein
MNNEQIISRIRQNLASRGIIKPDVVATQGYLRFHSNISTQLSAFTFPVLETSGSISAGEKRLAITDMFTITHWSIYVGRCAASAAGATPTDAQASQMQLYTNNNPNVFTNASGDAQLRALYNGQLTVTVDRERLIDGYDLQRFYRVGWPLAGTLQFSAATGAGIQNLDYYQGPNYGMAELSPEITLNGVGQNDITVSLPAPTTFIPTGNFTNFAVMVARGIRWQNASKLNA